MKSLFLLAFSCLLFVSTTHSFAQCTGNITLETQADVDAFPTDYGCSVIEGYLDIGGLDIGGVYDLTALESITSIEGHLIIRDNDNLINLDGLSNISNIGGDLRIISNSLINLDGLSNISQLEGDLLITGEDNLINIDGLSNISQVGGYLSVGHSDNLLNIDGLSNISEVGGYLSVSYNDNLLNIDGLSNISNVGGDLKIRNNSLLNNLDGLNNISQVGGYLSVGHNDNLLNIDGLSNISQVGGYLMIIGNDNLINLDGLSNISQVEGLISISYNDNLINLDGLGNISQVEELLYIVGNVNLGACCAILPLLEEVDVYIDNNLLSCNSIDNILGFCTGNRIQAIAFFDENENNIIDSDEQSIQQSFNLEPDALYSFTDQSGVAHLYLEDFGEYELSLNNNNSLWEFTGTNNTFQISYIDSAFTDTAYYFPMTATADIINQNIDLSSSIIRCNQNTNYWLTYTNTGTTINDGYVELISSNLTNLFLAYPPADSTAGDKLYWFYEDLYPTHVQQIHLVYEMPGVDDLGEQITFEANIETNEGFGDDKAILSSELICAYDPNDKLVTPFGYGDENYTLFGDTLEYTVRFQNTGNDTAFTVIIEDELSEYLDLNTFRPIASSHNVETRIDIDSRLATFTFNDIYLPDSFVNEPGSHGFIKYQILGNEGLSENTDVKNTASIFFDQNPAIVTNTVNNRLVSELPGLAILAVSEDELNFGEIALDEVSYVPQILVIENPGDLTLYIEQFYFEGAVFNSGDIQTISVEGQGSVEIPIYFSPSEISNYQSQLIIKSNVGELTIDLMGSAVLGTGLNSIKTNAVNLFPNPNKGQFYIESKEHRILSVQIINSLGEPVLEQTVPNTDASKIDLKGQPKGIYFIIVQTADGITVQKFLVQ